MLSVKKVIIEKKDFPPLSPNGEYLLRYRIISEDKNRTSHWSPVYRLDSTAVPVGDGTFKNLIEDVDSNIDVTPSGIIITWGQQNNAPLYDIFVSFKIGGTWQSYFYHGSSPLSYYTFEQPIRPTAIGYGATDVKAVIQLAGIEKTINEILTISTAAEKSLTPTISGGKA
jgi:hypothetical protein